MSGNLEDRERTRVQEQASEFDRLFVKVLQKLVLVVLVSLLMLGTLYLGFGYFTWSLRW